MEAGFYVSAEGRGSFHDCTVRGSRGYRVGSAGVRWLKGSGETT